MPGASLGLPLLTRTHAKPQPQGWGFCASGLFTRSSVSSKLLPLAGEVFKLFLDFCVCGLVCLGAAFFCGRQIFFRFTQSLVPLGEQRITPKRGQRFRVKGNIPVENSKTCWWVSRFSTTSPRRDLAYQRRYPERFPLTATQFDPPQCHCVNFHLHYCIARFSLQFRKAIS